jgi:ribose 5-phosphate isomerase A
MSSQEAAKRAAAYFAVEHYVKPNCRLGMGTGSTAAFVLERVTQLWNEGKLPGLKVVPTSLGTEWAARQAGLPVTTLDDPTIQGELDLTLDGADVIAPDLSLIKGGGGALLTEKIIARASHSLIIVADETKLQPSLGTGFPLPLEVLPQAQALVLRLLRELGAQAEIRQGGGKAGPVITDSGHILIDVTFSQPVNPAEMEWELDKIPGVIESGLFVGLVNEAVIGYADGSVRVLKKNGG